MRPPFVVDSGRYFAGKYYSPLIARENHRCDEKAVGDIPGCAYSLLSLKDLSSL
jgi:hypothetical protein